ncbi:conjugative transfer signal peptidase TraF [Massilia sp. YMA4]|uniref:Signal peptidase I n=1 Tax=[Empedobacter] haloabium TaxID=592317 RepID=A0ABZ1USU4_9BURK|nr:conjugative transfer signal peptidase TraF [Massilia sp. YMA4]AXA91343.1 conjugative transfer signal peptidase TraF [Massilia sp. YMA4]
MKALLTHARNSWVAFLAMLIAWAFALVRLFADPMPRLPVLFNFSPSLPFMIVLADYSVTELHRGDYIIYACDGRAVAYFPGLRRQALFKRIVGIQGDTVSVVGRQVLVNGRPVGYAKRQTSTRMALQPISPGTIPPGFFYVVGTHADSFDSRYAIAGLVARRQILARVRPLL